LKELDDLEKAVYVKRFGGRIKKIREAFNAYKKSLEPSLWQKILNNKFWFKTDEKE